MRQKSILPVLLIILLPIFTFSQTHILTPNGKLIRSKDEFKTEKKFSVKTENGISEEIASQNEEFIDLFSTPDTLGYARDYNFNTDFGFYGQDVMMQYFVAPADMTIKGIGFSCSDDSGTVNGADVSIRLIKLNWTWEKLDSINSELYLGYYPSTDSFNNADYFGEDAIGNWQDSTKGVYPTPPWTDNADPTLNTFDYDLWSDSGKGINVTPIKQESAENYQWIDTDILGFEPVVQAGEVFAVVIKHTGQNLGEDRIGFWASNEPGFLGWKYYASDRITPNYGLGWWVRQYTWDFAVAVDLGPGPRIFIGNITELKTTADTGPRTVQATITIDNPSGAEEGIKSAEILYSIDDGLTFNSIEMEYQGNFIWSGEILGQTPGTEIIYKIRATDIGGYSYESRSLSYKIFEVINTNILVLFNGGTEARAIQLTPYYLQRSD